MADVESLKKDGKAEFGSTKYKFLSEAKTTAEMRKQLVKHKIVILPIEVEENIEGKITHGIYTYKMVNVENPEEYIILKSGGQGHDSTDKGSGKASSYAYKYLMWRTFAIPSNDDPDKTTSDETVAKEKDEADFASMGQKQITIVQAVALDRLIERFGVDKLKLMATYKVATLEALTNEQWSDAQLKLKQKYEK